MSILHLQIEQLRASREATYYDFLPHMKISDNVNPQRDFRPTQNNISAPKLLNDCIHRPHTMKVIGCKSEPVHHVLRRAPVSSTMGMYPSVGFARKQEKGLAWLPNQPISGPLMPLSSSMFAGANNKLGQPK